MELQRLGILSSQAARPSSTLEYAYNVLMQDPKNAGKSQAEILNMAGQVANMGSLARTDMSAIANAQKAKKDLLSQRNIWSGIKSDYAKNQVQNIDKQIADIDAAFGKVGVGLETGSSQYGGYKNLGVEK